MSFSSHEMPGFQLNVNAFNQRWLTRTLSSESYINKNCHVDECLIHWRRKYQGNMVRSIYIYINTRSTRCKILADFIQLHNKHSHLQNCKPSVILTTVNILKRIVQCSILHRIIQSYVWKKAQLVDGAYGELEHFLIEVGAILGENSAWWKHILRVS